MAGVIRHEANNSYLIMKEEEVTAREEFLLGMITENQISGLLQVTRNQFNGEGELYYCINGYMSLVEICEKKQIGQEDFRRLLLGIQGIVKQMENYLLDGDSLLLEPESLFFSKTGNSYAFCYNPFIKRDLRGQIQDLGEYLLNHICHEEEKVVELAYEFYRITREEHFEIQQVVEDLAREKVPFDSCSKEREETLSEDSETVPCQTEQSQGEQGERNHMLAIRIQGGFCCLSVAGFLFFLYTCMLKRYYYGYSFLHMLSTMEVQISFLFLMVSLVFTIVIKVLISCKRGRNVKKGMKTE